MKHLIIQIVFRYTIWFAEIGYSRENRLYINDFSYVTNVTFAKYILNCDVYSAVYTSSCSIWTYFYCPQGPGELCTKGPDTFAAMFNFSLDLLSHDRVLLIVMYTVGRSMYVINCMPLRVQPSWNLYLILNYHSWELVISIKHDWVCFVAVEQWCFHFTCIKRNI